MTDTNGNAELYAKIARVMGEIGELEKKGRNAYFGYEFIRDVDVANAVRPLLAEEGVCLLVGMEDVTQTELKEVDRNTGQVVPTGRIHTLARISVTFADGETGATTTVPWYGEAIDGQDKGVNKCATAAVKYALMKTLLIGTDDDPDAGAPRGGSRAQRGNGRGSATPDMEEILATELNFGKYMGKTLRHVVETDPGYLTWLASNWNWDRGRAMAQALLESLDGPPAGSVEAPAGGNGGAATSTDYWRLAKQLKGRGLVTDDDINRVKGNHQGENGIDWGGAIDELKRVADGMDEPPF